LIQEAFQGIDQERLLDCHLHLAGIKNANMLHPDIFTWRHPINKFIGRTLLRAFGSRSFDRLDEESVETLVSYIEAWPLRGKFCLLAVDKTYKKNGEVDDSFVTFHVSNTWVKKVSDRYPHLFFPVYSVHPYRKDALEELDRVISWGARVIKWLPNSMGVNPSEAHCLAFYQTMHEAGCALLTHAGKESIVPSHKFEEFGNPLLLRSALDAGVRVIVGHCATAGKSQNLDEVKTPRRPTFSLFLNMMREERYKGRLFADLSATTQINRMWYLATLIKESQPGGLLENRLINGSDYPLPCIPHLISPFLLRMKGFLTHEESHALREIFLKNPLLFDFVLKRTLRHPETKKRFPLAPFMMRNTLFS
jgi:uncharacterized protein